MTEKEFLDILNKYCPNAEIEKDDNSYDITMPITNLTSFTNLSEQSVKEIIFEYAFIQEVNQKFQKIHIGYVQYTLIRNIQVDFEDNSNEITAQGFIPLLLNAYYEFETNKNGLAINGIPYVQEIVPIYGLTLKQSTTFSTNESFETIQEKARQLANNMLQEFKKI